jgi:hypothetical protein
MTDLDRLEEEATDAIHPVDMQRCIAKIWIAIGRRLDYIIVNGVITRQFRPEPTDIKANGADSFAPPTAEGPSFTHVDAAPTTESEPEHLEFTKS